MDGFLPPVDQSSWLDYQRRRAERFARERIAAAGSGAGDWIGRATQTLDGLVPDWAHPQPPPPEPPPPPTPVASPLTAAGDWAQGALARIGQIGGDLRAGWDSDLARIRREREAVEQQFPTPEPTGPAGFTLPQTGTPEGERITTALAETATRETPGGRFMTELARAATGDARPMTADTPLGNVGTMAGLAFQNVGAPLPARGPLSRLGQAVPGSVAIDTAARAAAQALPGGGTSVLEGAEIPQRVPFIGGQRVTRDTPLLGGLTTPDVAGPLAAGVVAGEPDDLLRLSGAALDLGSAAGGRALQSVEDLARVYGQAGIDPGLGLRGRALTPEDRVALARRAFRPPTGPRAPGAGMTPEELAQRVRDAQEALYTWQAGETAEVDYVARLLSRETPGTEDWRTLIGSGRVDPDALNRALVAYREEGLSEADALARALGTPEERLARLQMGEAAGGVRDPSGLTKRRLQNAIADLGADGRPFVTKEQRGAYLAGRNAPPPPDSKKNAWEYVDKRGQSWWLTSPYEVWFAKQLDQNPNVAYWAQSSPEAVMETTVRHGGEPKVFTPDFIVVGTDGRVQVVEIKNYGSFRQVPWRVPEKLREAEEFFNTKGIGFSIFVEDQLGRQAVGRVTPDDFLPDADGRMGVVNGYYVESEDGAKVGRFDTQAARQELVTRLQESARGWDTNELGYLSGRHPVTQEEYDELLASTHWPAWAERYDRRRGPNGERRPAPITPDQRRKIIAAGVGGSHPAEGGFGRPYEGAYPLPPEQGGYHPWWTPHQAFAEFNERQRRKGAPSIAVDAVRAYPQMRAATAPIFEHWGRQVAAGQHGMTVDPFTGQTGVPGRYAVSIAPGMELEVAGTPDQIHPDRLAMWMAEMEPLLREIPQARVGFWYDSGANRTYLDVSIGLDNRRDALALGRRMSQKAIYDAVTGKDIDLLYPGLPAGARPPRPSVQEQEDALVRFGQQSLRRQRGGAGAPGAPAVALHGGHARAPGAAQRRGAGGVPGGVPGAEAPGYGRDAGSGEPGLGGVEPGLGPVGAGADGDARPFGSYPPPVPYAPLAARSSGSAELGPGLRGRVGDETGAASLRGAGALGLGAGVFGGGALGAQGLATGTGQALDWLRERSREEQARREAGDVAYAEWANRRLGEGTLSPEQARFFREAGEDVGAGVTKAGGAQLTRAQRKLAAAQARTPRPGTVTWSDIPTILGSVPLMAPSSLAANFTGGMARSLERVLGQAFELRPVDAAVDLWNMAKAVPGATGRFTKSVRRGPTAGAQGAMGAPTKGDLSTRGGKVPGFLTGGVRLNAATDQFWRDLNEAGARAVAVRRGLSGQAKGDFARRAGDYATFTGDNSIVANKLTEMKGALHDPNASLGDKVAAGIVTAHAPYIMMPERLLRATVLAPVEQGYGVLAALKRGDPAAAREAAGRLGVSIGALSLFYAMYQQGSLTGDRPTDPNEARRREAQGAQWNTIDLPVVGRVPTRYLGSLGMQASLMASVLDAAERAEAKGADPGAVWEARANELVGWSFDNSYLADLGDFVTALGERRFADAGREALAGTLARPLPIVPGVLSAADPYEREATDFPGQLAMRSGLRATQPARIDPTTGELQRRRGSGWSRYFGERGSVQTPEATELARLGLQPRVLGRTEEFEGAKQTPAQRRAAQRASGSETGRALRAAVNSPGYRDAPDEEKKRLLQAALREAATRADIAAGEQVARSTQSQAERAWQAIPKYEGVEGTPDEIRKQNAAIARAKAAQAAAKRQGDEALDRWERENPALADLAATRPVNPRYLTLDREEIEAQYGVRLGG